MGTTAASFGPQLDSLALGWERALDAADGALKAGGLELPARMVSQSWSRLRQERQETSAALSQLARTVRAPLPWLSPEPVKPRLIGLPDAVGACVFDVDGVLTNSETLHALAWAEALNELLRARAEHLDWRLPPFDPRSDYATYLCDRPRLDGVHAFLASRGIKLPEGDADDPPELETAHGIANRKRRALERQLHRRGVNALAGSHRYLAAVRYAGLRSAVVSASANTRAMLDLAGIAGLVEECIDAPVFATAHLRPRPAPDAWLFACRELGVPPERTAVFVHDLAGVIAARRAGSAFVLDVDHGEEGEATREAGANAVIPSLDALVSAPLRDLHPSR